VIDRQAPVADVQWPVEHERLALGHHSLVIGLENPGFVCVVEGSLHDAFADDVFAPDIEGFQVTVVATLQQSLPITHIDWMRRAVEQRAHEFQLVAQGAFG